MNITIPTVIGIGGKKQHGKDAYADHLVDAHGFVKVGFSDCLHAYASIINPLVKGAKRYNHFVETLGFTAAKEVPEVRRTLIGIGDALRTIDAAASPVFHTWVTVRELIEAGKNVVVSGVRFPAEIDLIKGFGGTNVYIERPNFDTADQFSTDATETSVSAEDFAQLVINDGSLEDLYAKADVFAGAVAA